MCSTCFSTTTSHVPSTIRGLTVSSTSGRRSESARRIVEQIVDSAPVVPLLHALVPQKVGSVVEVLKILDKSLLDVEQVIEVPKIVLHKVPQRSPLLEPQTAEQLVEVLGFEFAFFRRYEGALGLRVVRAAGHTWFMRGHDTGWRDSPGRNTNTG